MVILVLGLFLLRIIQFNFPFPIIISPSTKITIRALHISIHINLRLQFQMCVFFVPCSNTSIKLGTNNLDLKDWRKISNSSALLTLSNALILDLFATEGKIDGIVQ